MKSKHITEEIKELIVQNPRKRPYYEQFGEIYIEVIAILWQHDPIRLKSSPHKDEYEPEARTIVARLQEATSEKKLLRIVYEEFVKWFGSTAKTDSHDYLKAKYPAIAHDIWVVYLNLEFSE